MDDLINDFIAETREMLEALSGEIVAWEAMPEDRARLDEIFRFVHTVKGNSGFFDLPRIGALSHAAEDALAEVRAGRRQADRPLVSAVLAIVDRIAETRAICPGISEIAITVNAGGAPHWMAIKNQEMFASAVIPRVRSASAELAQAG